ncbi:effector-associated constant component EACC1 [Nocardia sp. NPDC003693]
MNHVSDRWQLWVVPVGDIAVTERLTRDLRNELNRSDEFAADFQSVDDAPPVTAGSKGLADGELLLTIAVAGGGALAGAALDAAAQALVQKVMSWSGRHRNSAVELTLNGNQVTLSGQTADVDRIVAKLINPPQNDTPPDGAQETGTGSGS